MPATHLIKPTFSTQETYRQVEACTDVVISGVSCRFPESLNMEQYAKRLFNQSEVIMPRKTEFDYGYFGITSEYADKMTLQSKFLVECTYDAIIDAGLVPTELKGTRTGFFVATTETEKERLNLNEFVPTVFGYRGPWKYFCEFSSSFIALDAAYRAIELGECDQAIVCGIDMYTNEPSVGCVFIQKRDVCKRFYSKILDSQIYETKGFQNFDEQRLREFYAQWKIDPTLVTYVENFGEEKNREYEFRTLAKLFAPSTMDRTLPVYFGATQYRFTTGIYAILKMVVAMQSGNLPASYETIEYPTIKNVKFLQSTTKFYGGLMAMNSFGLTGSNVHMVLQPNTEYLMSKLGDKYFWNQDLKMVSNMPRLFTFSARTQQGLEQVMEEIRMNPTDMAAQFLMSEVNTPFHQNLFRGYCILNAEQKIQRIEQVKTENLPVYFVFNGLNVNCFRNYKDMMKIETFNCSIRKFAEYLRPFKFDLIECLEMTSRMTEQTLYSCVAITAFQMALVDCLCSCGVEASGFIGYSIGELACAYADKCLTAQETLLIAYYRALCIQEAKLPAGCMAIVGLTWEQAQKRCPVGVIPACYNHEENVTISGPRATVLQFIQQLTTEGIYVKELDTCNIAYHSHFMTSLVPQMKKYLEKVILTPKMRTSKWISTSFPEQRWSTDLAKFASIDYFINNLCNHVLFNEALNKVPKNAIVIEIGPQSIMQTILQKALPTTCYQIPLMSLNNNDLLIHFWTMLGNIYISGVQVTPINLFVPRNRDVVVFPVPIRTRFLNAQHQQLNVCIQKSYSFRELMGQNIEQRFNRELPLYETQLGLIKNLMKQEKMVPKHLETLSEYEYLIKQYQIKKTFDYLEELIECGQRLECFYTQKTGQQWRYVVELNEFFTRLMENEITLWRQKYQNTTIVSTQYQQEKLAIIRQFLKMNLTTEQVHILKSLETLYMERTTYFRIEKDEQPTELRRIEFLELYCKQDVQQMKLITQLREIIRNQIIYQYYQPMQQVTCKKTVPTMRPLGYKVNQQKRVSTEEISSRYQAKYTIDFASCVEDAYLLGYKVQGKTIYPASAYIYLVWKTFTRMYGYETVEQLPVQFFNIRFLDQLTLVRTEKYTFNVWINRLTGLFEVTVDGKTICTGNIETLNKLVQLKESFTYETERLPEVINHSEIYKCLKQRGYELQEEFQPLVKTNLDGTYGELTWTGRWISFLDGMIQMNIWAQKSEGVCLPTLIKSLRIEPSLITNNAQQKIVRFEDENNNTLNTNWLEEEYQYIMNGKVSTPTETTYNREYQWIVRFQQYQQEQLVWVRDILKQENWTAAQIRLFEELEICLQQCKTIGEFRMGFDYTQKLYEQLALLQQQLELIYNMKTFFVRRESLNEDTQMIEDFRMILREQLQHQNYERKLETKQCEENTFTTLLRKQLDTITLLLESQFNTPRELTMFQELEKFIMEQQYIHSQKTPVELTTTQWMTQIRRHQTLLNKYNVRINQFPEFRTIFTFLEKMIREQLQHELDFQTQTTQMFGTVEQRLNMNYNLVQKLIGFSQKLNVSGEDDSVIKRMYLEKLEQLVQEMYEQNMLSQAIQESMYETYESRRLRLQEYLEKLEKFNWNTMPVCNTMEQRTDIQFELERWQQTFEKFQKQASEFIQYERKWTIPVYYNGLTRTIVCRGIELTGLYLAPVMSATPVMTIRQFTSPMTQLFREDKQTKNELIEMDLLNLIEAMHSLETLKDTESLRQREITPVSTKFTTRVTYTPIRQYIGSEETDRQLIEECGSMGKKLNYLMPQKCIVPLNQVDMYEVGLYKPTPVVIIHPIEGHTNTLRNLAKYIKAPVWGVQYTRQAMQYETVEELAQFYWSKIQAQFGETRVHLCGHAFGALIALQMSAFRPERCLSLTVLDDNITRKTYKFHSEVNQEIESDALVKFAQQYLQTMNKVEFYQQLVCFETLNQRIRFVVRELMNRSLFRFEPVDLEYAARSFVAKYFMLVRYTPCMMLRLPVVNLIKCGQQSSLIQTRTLLQTLLEQCFSGRLDCQYVDCDVKSFLEGNNGYQVATILNENFLRHF